jgi:hypothetical protein
MSRLFGFLGATIGGSLGWWLGSSVGFFTAFLVSIVGTAAGIYYGKRAARHYLP